MVRIYLTCLLVLTLSCINAQGKNSGDIKIKLKYLQYYTPNQKNNQSN